MIREEEVWKVLKECYDPEIPINIVDLGLVYEVNIIQELAQVKVKMTLTAPGCPMTQFIAENIRQKLLQLPEVKDAVIEIVWDPPWNPERISEEGRKKLGLT